MSISKRSQELLLQSQLFELVRVLDVDSAMIHHNITQSYVDSNKLYVCKFLVADTWFYLMETHDYYRHVFNGFDHAIQFISSINSKITEVS